jgi:predicted Zn-dependent protease with MMP-like domain
VNPRSRNRFDRLLDQVLEKMPPLVHELLDKIPLHVEDYPSEQIMDQMGVEYLDDLCGLFTGVPITDRSLELSGHLPDVVTIYREGILSAASDAHGRITADALREEIRKTILHELAHYHGLGEQELWDLGYG